MSAFHFSGLRISEVPLYTLHTSWITEEYKNIQFFSISRKISRMRVQSAFLSGCDRKRHTPHKETGYEASVLGTCMAFILYSIAGSDPSGRDADICHLANHISVPPSGHVISITIDHQASPLKMEGTRMTHTLTEVWSP